MQLTEQQQAFFDAFGYLVFPGVMKSDIAWITDEFERVFEDRHIAHDGTKRSCVVPFIDQRERLCTLLDHPVISGILSGLLGDDWNYLNGDGNYYTGDTGWHSDGYHTVGRYVKIAFYLDPVTRDTGALRVIPGTHRDADDPRRQATNSQQLWGIPPCEVPALALESNPGDLVAFNHNLMHAACGGSTRRRMFTINCNRHCATPEEIQDLEDFVGAHDRFWNDHMHGDLMRTTASPARQRHLQQVMEHEAHLPALAAKARERMGEPSRG
jgi:hypothetical protein